MNRKIVQYIAFTSMVIALIIGGYFYWLHQQRYPGTDDAYIQAHVVNVAPQVSGRIEQVYVQNQQAVKQNQLLFTVDPTPFQIALDKAKANLHNTIQQIQAAQNAVNAAQAALSQRQAELIDSQKNYERIIFLVKKGFYAKSGGDDATRELTVAKASVAAAQDQLLEAKAKLGKPGDQNARIQAAKAAIAQASLNLQYTTIVAPASGQLAQFTLQPGQTVTAYDTLFSLVENQAWWAMANMKETNLQRVHVGQKAIVAVDMYPAHLFHGIVKSISPSSGSSFSLLPAENATGNWVKVTQRFPVKIEIQDVSTVYPLRIGASCTVTIDTK
ncbi:MAG: multidrug transporter [Gammaproteobacteria bacterium RIFCSPHIGHO2_02_FULL_39_13]|nr:MAG: multidrug transporter [Gammaproteobacteria bacterium RIFCSPHIGHO2_02_FULL_39_13]OGT50442.1 MAG: multidrug transporter [Gammaproteobacteria bacterium RIFCSPHIGHO2_12_FULL_39_24]